MFKIGDVVMLKSGFIVKIVGTTTWYSHALKSNLPKYVVVTRLGRSNVYNNTKVEIHPHEIAK